MSMDTESEASIKFDYNGLATWPLWLHYTRVLDYYTGDALCADGHPRRLSRHLFVPPNVAAVVLFSRRGRKAHGEFMILPPGRHHIRSVLEGGWPVSVQYVRTDKLTYDFELSKVPTSELLTLDLKVWFTVQVVQNQAQRATQLHEPVEDIKHTIRQWLIARLRGVTHEAALKALPGWVEGEISQGVASQFAAYGLEVKVGLTGFEPDSAWRDLQREAGTVDKKNEVGRRVAQMKEDVFALEQPGLRRMAAVNIATQMREKNQEARMEAIDTVKDLAKALVEDLRRFPGRVYTEKDMQPLVRALELLDKLAQPVPPPSFPTQVRSYFALDATSDNKTPYPPPEYLPPNLPVPPGSVWDPNRPTGQSQPPPPAGTPPQSPGPAAPATDPAPRWGEKQ